MTRTVLISGISSGIGAAIAARLAGRGDQVLGLSRSPPAQSGITWQPADVCDSVAVVAATDALLTGHDHLDAVICNAGVGLLGSVEDVPLDAARRLFDVNYFGVVNVLKATLPRLRAQGKGKVLIMASLASRVPLPFQAHYSASKAALESLGMALGEELAPHGIGVSLIEPGDIRSGFNAAMRRFEDPGSRYHPWLARCAQSVSDLMKNAQDPKIIGDLVEDILECSRPRPRYAIGSGARLVTLATRVFTDRMNLGLIRRHYRL
jgi:NAD(P)-dependent dehydrogenase (short-subunit alcohol dehydrogenase family)